VTAGPPAVRPRNRRQLIVEAAGRAFSERGYHAASMEEIAAAVGITAAALYRHFPNKYALFTECANVLAGRLVAALAEPGVPLAEVLRPLARVTVAHRTAGGLYRWESRYLERADRQQLSAKFAQVMARVTEAVRPLPDADLRAAAALGAIGSITMHRTSIAQRRAEDLLTEAALRVAAAPASAAPSVELPAHPEARNRRAEIIAAAVPLFERDGFAAVTNARIAEAVGLVPSALYRHFPTKAEILAAACLQAAGLLAEAVDQNLHGATGSAALPVLAATYVAYSFEHTALTNVAAAELGGLPAALQQPLIHAQRAHIAVWERELRRTRPELDAHQARVLVHAGFGVVVETGRRLRWRDLPEHRAAVTGFVLGALGG